jgi:hypothetical protein
MLTIKNIVTDTYTNSAGYSLYQELKKYIAARKPVTLSFKGVSSTSSSFLNSSFGSLIEEFGLPAFTSFIKPVDITASEAEIIRKYVSGFRQQSSQ